MAYSDKSGVSEKSSITTRTLATSASQDRAEVEERSRHGLVGAPACGDVMRLEIRVKDGLIADARFKTFWLRLGDRVVVASRPR